MKHTLLALKLYLTGLAVALFIVGWALIARQESVGAVARAATPQRVDAAESIQARLPDLAPIPSLPAIRTRTS